MNQSFYIGAIGAQQQQLRLNVHSNNLANLNTYGYKTEKPRFQSLIYDDIKAIGEEMLPSGTGMRLSNTDTDFSGGAMAATGRAQDYAIEGDGFFALADLKTGEISLTRNGAFTMASLRRAGEGTAENGDPVMEEIFYLSDGNGRFVLGKTGGMIEMTDANEKQEIGVFDYINYNGRQHIDGTRFLAVDKNGGLSMSDSKVLNGMLEASNADMAEEMTKIIEAQRAYSMALKMVQTSDEVETTINNLRG